jgi:3-hydroxy-3-methylglutaryl CoA synthase
MVLIDGYGGYVPLYRIERDEIYSQYGGSGSGESAVPGHDENHVTMASEAAGVALDRAGVSAEDLGAVCTASITDPFAEHGIAAHVAFRLGAPQSVRTGDFRSTGRAATDALCFARQFVAATDEPALVVGVDVMPAEPDSEDEPYAGAGAGAVVLRTDADDPGGRIDAVGQSTTGFVERHRLHDEPAVHGDGAFEGEYGFGEAIESATGSALAETDVEFDHAIVTASDHRMARGAVESVPGEVSMVSTFDDVGYAGTASFFLDLASLLETASAGDGAVAAAYGAGGADVVVLETDDGVGAEGSTVAAQIDAKEYVSYGKHLQYRERTEYQGASGV